MSRVYWGCTTFGCPRGFSGGDTEGSQEDMPRTWAYCPGCGGELHEVTAKDEAICPDCKHPVESHAMFDPPRCPVIRLDWGSRAWV